MTDTERKKKIEQLLKDSKTASKGRFYVYEQYKQRLRELNPTNEEYCQACRQLSINLQL